MFFRFFVLAFALLLSAPAVAQTENDGYVDTPALTLDEQMTNASDGDVASQYNLGMKYARGDGVPQDYKVAAKWLEMAANKGDMDAQAALGVMYQKGQGVQQDNNIAASLYKRAAAQGDKMSQYNLASIYASGRGSMRNDKEAFFWVTLASVENTEPQVTALHDTLAARLTPADISEAQQRASLWVPEKKPEEEMPEKLQYGQ
ncbi:MAG: sel1 repeat family protein [Alphaproteobacteria bacterium]|jgi:TPR repeat protein|nr:sel1 repeat family protein [Alphaproteobacteria bacterium]